MNYLEKMIKEDIDEIKKCSNSLEVHIKALKLTEKIDTWFYVGQKILSWEREYLRLYVFKTTCTMDSNFASKEL